MQESEKRRRREIRRLQRAFLDLYSNPYYGLKGALFWSGVSWHHTQSWRRWYPKFRDAYDAIRAEKRRRKAERKAFWRTVPREVKRAWRRVRRNG